MEVFAAIHARRTIKDFRPDPVPSDLLERALTAGLWAQNHKLTQPWRWTILGPETHRRLAAAFARSQVTLLDANATPAEREHLRAKAAEKILNKPCIVAVSQHLSGPPAQRKEDYAAIACAIQNVQLAAWADGVGMQWSSGKIIALPENYATLAIDSSQEELVGLLFFGYPATIPPAQPRKPLAEVCCHLP